MEVVTDMALIVSQMRSRWLPKDGIMGLIFSVHDLETVFNLRVETLFHRRLISPLNLLMRVVAFTLSTFSVAHDS